MNDTMILPVKPGTIAADDRAELRAAGIIVIECEAPDELRLLRARSELSHSDMLQCALTALSRHEGTSVGDDIRDKFARLMIAATLKAMKA